MFLNGIMPTENESTVKEPAWVVLNSVIMKLLNLGFHKGMRFPWFVFDFLTVFCMW